MNHLVDQYFDSLIDKKIAVLGIGVSNRPLIRMLLAHGLHVLACDKTPREKLDAEVLELERAGTVLHVGEHYLDDVQADIVFRTPGMHPDIPALRRLREKGAELTSEMEAFFEVCPCRIIAVTGSDGKTTTTTLIAKILEHAGHRVWVGGNPVSRDVKKVQDFGRVGHAGKDQSDTEDQSGQKGDDIEHLRLPDSDGRSRR